MDLSLSSTQWNPTDVCETSSPASLLEHGIRCIRQGHYAEGAAFFALARERFTPDQMHLADLLDAFLQSHALHLQAQQALHIASKYFVETDTEQETHLIALEKLLAALEEDTERIPQPHFIAQPLKNSWTHQPPLSLQLPPTHSINKPSLPHSLLKDGDAPPELYFTCFGRFEVRRLGQPILLCSSRNAQSILRYLITQPGHYATSDILQTILWPEDEPSSGHNKLHIAISVLRRSLNDSSAYKRGGGNILCKNGVYYLNPAVVVQTDVGEFLHYYQSGQQTNEGRMAFYEEACRFYTGPFLPEEMYADWSFFQREELSRIYLTMCRVLADYYLKIKRYENAEKWAIAILKENRCNESAHRQLMQIYAAQGRRSEALQQYQRCTLILREALGVQPSPETVLVFQTLLANEPSSSQ
jgi:DNA-binding SARP family transcriptional activator